jgi:uncharacterized RDD family membrane protein YckC
MGKRLLAAIIDGDSRIAWWSAGLDSNYDLSRRRCFNGGCARQHQPRRCGRHDGRIFLGYFLLFIGSVLVWLFQIYLLGRDGATLGKRWLKIKVVDQTGQPLGFGKAFLRELVKQLLGGLCFLLYLWPLFDNQKQGLWDKLFNTHV